MFDSTTRRQKWGYCWDYERVYDDGESHRVDLLGVTWDPWAQDTGTDLQQLQLVTCAHLWLLLCTQTR